MRRWIFLFALLFTADLIHSPQALAKSKSRRPASKIFQKKTIVQSKIQHLVLIIQENHTFDNYFGTYCQAPSGSNPQCTLGPSCCEAAPRVDPGSNTAPTLLTDLENSQHNPDHSQSCELAEMNGGKMDHFVTDACGNKRNFASADPQVIAPYLNWASQYALADRYFQPVAGASSANDMYFARAGFVFKDNDAFPDSLGARCAGLSAQATHFNGPTIGHLLNQAQVSWTVYAEGYQDLVEAQKTGQCPKAPAECSFQQNAWPCTYDPSDIPFSYYTDLQDKPSFMRDFAKLEMDLNQDSLPAVIFIKAAGYHSEHPGKNITISAGSAFVKKTVDRILNSRAGASTLILVTTDEGGGYFDHISPPPPNPIDGQSYGTRVPMLAIGPFARTNTVSHVIMEHSSVVKFIEWNWLLGKTGQLGMRDRLVNNIGSLLDANKTGVKVPEN